MILLLSSYIFTKVKRYFLMSNAAKLYYLFFFIWISACQSAITDKNDAITTVDTVKQTTQKILPTVDSSELKEKELAEKIIVPDYDTIKWTDMAFLEPSVVIDMRYATTNNFVEEQMYACGRCFLRPEVAKAIVVAHKKLQEQGLGLKMYDCFRPRPIQWKLWNKTPDPRYVSDPRKGSMHNRGAAVDLTIVDKNGKELDMGTDFDFFGRRAYQTFTDLPQDILANRKLLRETLAEVGFRHIRTEWWHYAFTKKRYALSDMLWECDEVWAVEDIEND